MSNALDAMDHYSYKSEGLPLNLTNTFKLIIDDMDKQYFEIRTARKKLYNNDDLEYPDRIDLESWMCDEPIGWTVNEPSLGPSLNQQSTQGQHNEEDDDGGDNDEENEDQDPDSESENETVIDNFSSNNTPGSSAP
ncbi:hypothetical protein BDZ45DRAFT_682332 [Acephala macrosclerotiorum]|nr:hypothetical protein BDZ45DRAFT_682332 [Acephala macrosclerotiorum]